MSERFVPTERTKVRRLHERGSYDKATVFAILDAGLVCHVGYVIDGQPYVTPTSYWRDGESVYWHGSSASRALRTQRGGVPVCLTVTHLDGLVLARSGFHHSMNYRAVMLFGRAALVEDMTAKRAALDAFVERLYPGRTAELRRATAQELKGTTVLRMEIEEASAKVRTGPPKDDADDYAADVWAGIVPLRLVAGTPVADPQLKSGTPMPAHVQQLVAAGSLDAALARDPYAGQAAK